MSVVNQVMGLIFSLLPIFFVVPLYFSGKVAYGSIDQVGAAAAMVLSGLSVISNFIPTMTSTMPSVVRLSEIQEKFNQLNDPQSARASTRIHHHEGESISLKQVDVATPGGEQQLVRNLSPARGRRPAYVNRWSNRGGEKLPAARNCRTVAARSG